MTTPKAQALRASVLATPRTDAVILHADVLVDGVYQWREVVLAEHARALEQELRALNQLLSINATEALK